MEYRIEPYVGVGPIRLGMTVEEVRQAVGGAVHSFRKGPFAKRDTDAFDDEGIYVYYKDPGVCAAVEFGGGAVMPTLDGHPLLKRPFREVYHLLKARDPSLQLRDAGLTSYLLGVGIYMSSMKEDVWERATEGVIVFEQGYYD